MSDRLLAFDFGAGSGRAMLGEYDGSQIALTEMHRFDHHSVKLHGTLYQDVLGMLHQVYQGLIKTRQTGDISSIGVDTWGVDFGLLDERGTLIQYPVNYRDTRTQGLMEEVFGRIPKDTIYQKTGTQFMEINTLFQLYALRKYRPDLLERAASALLMPDLLGYFLTGEQTAEYSMASTSQLMNAYSRQWDRDIFEALDIPADLFPPIVSSGTPLGRLTPQIREDFRLGDAQVISVTGHDTASAIVAAPATEKDFIYISCGTWCLFGTELDAPLINDKALGYNITNEGGYNNTTRFLKNICGLWLIQETRRQYHREGHQYSYNDLEQHALQARPFRYFIDPDMPQFAPPGDLPGRIRAYCRETGQGEPETVGEIMRCIYESLAMKYRHVFDMIRDCTGKEYRHIHMIGGGTKDNLLCQMTADSTGLPIIAGPIEATAMGNIAVQLMARGEIKDLDQARQVVIRSCKPITYEPRQPGQWNEAYGRFRKILSDRG